jgi:hypothetical protein
VLWPYLDRTSPFEDSRSKPVARQSERIHRLCKSLKDVAVHARPGVALDGADIARRHCNEIVHQDGSFAVCRACRLPLHLSQVL